MIGVKVVDGKDLEGDVPWGRAARAINGAMGIIMRPLPTPVRVIVRGSVFVVAEEDVGPNWHAVALAEGKIGGRRPGARGRRGIRTIPGARWLYAVKKGEIGRLQLGLPRRRSRARRPR